FQSVDGTATVTLPVGLTFGGTGKSSGENAGSTNVPSGCTCRIWTLLPSWKLLFWVNDRFSTKRNLPEGSRENWKGTLATASGKIGGKRLDSTRRVIAKF